MDKETILKRYKGKRLAEVIFDGYEGISVALGGKPCYQVIWAWRNNNVPAKHRATLVIEAKKRGWDIEEFDLRGDM